MDKDEMDITLDELKRIILPFIVAVLVFGFVFFAWLHSDMYLETKSSQRLRAQEYMMGNYYNIRQSEREFLMEEYGLTDEDIKPHLPWSLLNETD